MSKNFFTAPTAYPTFYRTYSHKTDQGRESWEDVAERNFQGFQQIGKLTDTELENIKNNQLNLTALPSGRFLWVGGTEWSKNPKNFYGAYNCTSLEVIDWATFGMLMNLAMCGTGTGAVLEPRCFEQLPEIRNKLNVIIGQPIGVVAPEVRAEFTDIDIEPNTGNVYITVGDSREGWVESYQALLELSSREDLPTELHVYILLGNVRPAGEKLKGFGGTANPIKLSDLYGKIAKILNKAIGRKLKSVECCLLIDEAAWCVVAGNIRRCLPEDTLVKTINGSVLIRDIEVGDVVETHRGFRKVTKKFDQGFQDVYQIITEKKGVNIHPRATLNHKYAVLNETEETITWKAVEDLQEGDKLLHHKEKFSPVAHLERFVNCYPVSFKKIGERFHVQTYDIEVEDFHCFFGDEYLTHNSAGMKQFIYTDTEAAASKLNLYTQTFDGKWVIDSEREALKMSNHTRIFYHRPTLEECLESLHLQYQCGEGAIMFAPEMIARANADLLDTKGAKDHFIYLICNGEIEGAKNFLEVKAALKEIVLREEEISHRMERVGLNPCGEIGMKDNLCNLAEVPLNQLNPLDHEQIVSAFTAAAHSVCCLLHHEFDFPRFQYSREVDPIVAVSFTGLFDFFVQLFGVDWLRWWEAGRPADWDKEYVVFADPKAGDTCPDHWVKIQVPVSIFMTYPISPIRRKLGECYKIIEQIFLSGFSDIVHQVVWEYCDRNGLRRPNRCTTVQPSGTKSLLTGASPGWHPPKAARFIRRITFSKNDPVALACIDYGYNVVPGQDDRDENGILLDDPFDPRVNTWLVEIPTSTVWADIPGADEIDISKFSALAQLDMLEQVQNFYTTHNTSATVEIREDEIYVVAKKFHEMMQNNRIVSTTVLARMDDKQTFPRLPFEPINQATYEQLVAGVISRRKSDDFHELLEKHDYGLMPISEMGPAACDSDKCLMP